MSICPFSLSLSLPHTQLTHSHIHSITKERTEVIFQGTWNTTINSKTHWQELEFKCKPGRISRRPCVISPYHYRLDWLMWFAAFQNYQYNPWLLHFAGKLLAGDPTINSLIEYNPFKDKPPMWVLCNGLSEMFVSVGGSGSHSSRRVNHYYMILYLHNPSHCRGFCIL